MTYATKERILKQLTRKTVSVIIAVIFIAGCAGRAANPVAVNQYGDTSRSCKAIESELSFIDSEVSRLIPATEKTGKNVALGVAGAFFLVPWFFMDFSQAEQTEINALRQRHNHLIILAGEKNCEMQRTQVQEVVKKSPEPTSKDLNQSNF
ncbi:hypothetical protein SAMN05216332_11319 [Nitrosospira briensis]|nr:hypothetical protein SAMN05216332_11319 [Nitrosospira briensis]